MNPYEVLGVEPNADEETVKKAYRALVRKYHPDKYVDNPLADLAAEKMKEINKAYDMITKGMTGNSTASGTYRNDGGSNSGYGGSYSNMRPEFSTVRMLMNFGQYDAALNMLNSLPKTAEWYYLRGLINMRRGYYDSAISDINIAISMDPDNAEYRSTLDSINMRNTTYTNTRPGTDDSCCMQCCDTLPCICLPLFCPGDCCIC